MLGGAGINPDSAIPRYQYVHTDRVRVSPAPIHRLQQTKICGRKRRVCITNPAEAAITKAIPPAASLFKNPRSADARLVINERPPGVLTVGLIGS